MGRRNKTQEHLTLLQLQNYIKRDPGSYRDEFMQQYRYYQSNLKIFQLQPSQPSKDMIELIVFISQIAHCYPEHLDTFPQELIDLIRQYQDVLDTELRLAICRALILIRNKNLLSPTSLLELFFELFRCKDKLLRKTLYNHIVADITNINLKHKNNKVNKALQGFMYKVLCDGDPLATRYSLEVMTELYKKSIWNDSKTVNAIVLACFSNVAKARVIAVKFFLGTDENEEEGSDSDDSDDAKDPMTMKGLLLSHQVSKKSRKKKKSLEKALATLKKHKKKRCAKSSSFSALYLINDPQAFAEKLYKELEKAVDKFEIRVMIADLISRLIGLHQLFLLNFYPFLQKYLQPHQQEVTKFLTFVARSSHDLIPPETLEPVLRTIVNNFITERNSGEVMAVGLNAVREMCAKCPNVMTEELLQDLTQYKTSRNKSVVMAARSLIQLYRYINPSLLRKKDRGKPTELSKEVDPLAFSEVKAAGYVPGTEFLEFSQNDSKNERQDTINTYDSEGDDHTSDEEGSFDSADRDDDEISEEEIADEIDSNRKLNINDRKLSIDSNGSNPKSGKATVTVAKSKSSQAEDISSSRFLTQEEFDKIRTEKVLRELDMRTGGKMKRKHLETMLDNEMEKELSKPMVSQDDIEIIHKKAKHDKESRLATVKEGREGRGKFTNEKHRLNEFASTSHKEKRKGKSFMMVRQATGVQRKIKRSFRQKQLALRDSMLKRRKSKR